MTETTKEKKSIFQNPSFYVYTLAVGLAAGMAERAGITNFLGDAEVTIDSETRSEASARVHSCLETALAEHVVSEEFSKRIHFRGTDKSLYFELEGSADNQYVSGYQYPNSDDFLVSRNISIKGTVKERAVTLSSVFAYDDSHFDQSFLSINNGTRSDADLTVEWMQSGISGPLTVASMSNPPEVQSSSSTNARHLDGREQVLQNDLQMLAARAGQCAWKSFSY